ncbi:MAG: energy-coupling factor transporter transmembrane protein EcfT [Eggerthellaceae bacterium]|nr:energy-coupling factor transporter transmembrane protein EcfT [Eggerthellaceae bacterium]
MNRVLLGQYWPEESLVHRMDPRVKFLLSLALIVAIFCAATPASLAVAALFVLVFYGFAHIPPLTALRSIGPLLVLVLFTALLNVLFVQGGEVYFQWWIICVSEKGLQSAAFIAVRLLLLLMAVSLLTLTTTTLDITAAFERLLAPFARVGLPAHEMGMILGIALRFLPQFAQELATVYRAQVSRGARFTANPFRGGLQSLTALMVPLFSSAFRHADTLSQAMDARCYHGGTGVTRLHPLRCTWRDAAGTAAVAAMFAAVLVVNAL